jgi:hypothetical protein
MSLHISLSCVGVQGGIPLWCRPSVQGGIPLWCLGYDTAQASKGEFPYSACAQHHIIVLNFATCILSLDLLLNTACGRVTGCICHAFGRNVCLLNSRVLGLSENIPWCSRFAPGAHCVLVGNPQRLTFLDFASLSRFPSGFPMMPLTPLCD